MRIKYLILIFFMSIGILPNLDKRGKLNFVTGNLYAQNTHLKGGIYDVNDNFLGYAEGTKYGRWSKGDGYYFKENELGLFRLWKNSPTKDREMRCHVPTPYLDPPNSDKNNENGEGMGGQEDTSPPASIENTFSDWMNDFNENDNSLFSDEPDNPDIPQQPQSPPYNNDPTSPCAGITLDVISIRQPTFNEMAMQTKNDGSIVVKASGSTSFTYKLGGTQNSDGGFWGLSAGTYLIEATDDKGCLIGKTIKLAPQNALGKVETITYNYPCKTCSYTKITKPDGSVQIVDPNDCLVIPNCPNGANKKPCKGDPIANPTIAPYGNNIKSGRNGNTRGGGEQYHDGLDIASPLNSDFYSMYPGKVVGLYNNCHGYAEKSYGNYVIIQSTLPNGETICIKYNHLNTINVHMGQIIDTDDVLGQTGKTGNAFKDTNVIPHIHIQVRPTNDFSQGNFRNYDPEDINPEKYLRTKFDAKGKPINPCYN